MGAEVSAQPTAWEKRWLLEEPILYSPTATVTPKVTVESREGVLWAFGLYHTMQRLIRVLRFAQEAETKKGRPIGKWASLTARRHQKQQLYSKDSSNNSRYQPSPGGVRQMLQYKLDQDAVDGVHVVGVAVIQNDSHRVQEWLLDELGIK
ncbi:hypothetical protein PoB_005392800 [Plakobranchus ocellatus]|uniref:Uncharacterized protein n=1 Tax=Plakobranchus ocellatus TaxID=259542 RepID=A0AAV4C7E6_9GAST|nr:hypothetical protein PoB_005392800 [Plakobranchus ocellatus]